MMYILLFNLQSIQNNAVFWAKCAHCTCVLSMVVFLMVENLQRVYKLCKGVKTEPGIGTELHPQFVSKRTEKVGPKEQHLFEN